MFRTARRLLLGHALASSLDRVDDYPEPFTIWTNGPESIGAELSAAGLLASSTTVWTTGNTAIYVPFVTPRTIDVIKLFWINGTTVSGNADIGIYDEAGNRLVSAGATAMAGTNAAQTVDTTDLVLAPGSYYLAMNVSNKLATPLGWTFSSAGTRCFGCLQQAVGATALPSTATFAALTDAASILIPAVALTARSIV